MSGIEQTVCYAGAPLSEPAFFPPSTLLTPNTNSFDNRKKMTGFHVWYESITHSRKVSVSYMINGRIVRAPCAHGSTIPSIVSKYQKRDSEPVIFNDRKIIRYCEKMTYVWYDNYGRLHRNIDAPSKVMIVTTKGIDIETNAVAFIDVVIVELYYKNGHLHRRGKPAWLEYRTTMRNTVELHTYRNFVDGLKSPVSDSVPCYMETESSSTINYQLVISRASNSPHKKLEDVYENCRIEKSHIDVVNDNLVQMYCIYMIIDDRKILKQTISEPRLFDMIESWYPVDSRMHPDTERLYNKEYPYYTFTNENELIGEFADFVILNVWDSRITSMNFTKPELPFQNEMRMIIDE